VLTVGSWITLFVAWLFIVAAVMMAIYSLYLSIVKVRRLESRLATAIEYRNTGAEAHRTADSTSAATAARSIKDL
jgi:hypothetical protein